MALELCSPRQSGLMAALVNGCYAMAPDSRSDARPAACGHCHHVQHRALPAELRQQDGLADLPDAGLMAWKRIFGKTRATAPLQEIIRHFNDAATDEENFPSTIDPRIYHVQMILRIFRRSSAAKRVAGRRMRQGPFRARAAGAESRAADRRLRSIAKRCFATYPTASAPAQAR